MSAKENRASEDQTVSVKVFEIIIRKYDGLMGE